MMMTVKNPTAKKKAVRIAGGFEVINPGKSADVDCVFSDDEKARYESAGLVFREKGEKPVKQEPVTKKD